jgi:hypothetical protein
MPDSVKISELSPRQAVSSDILPAVDSTFSQTVRVTAGQVAAIGGGPPGDTTVSTAKLINGAVTYPKIQDVSANKLLGRASAGSGSCEEISCSPFMRNVLAQADSLNACAAMGTLLSTADATFTGQLKLPTGSASAPSLAHSGDADTGIFFPYQNTIGFANDGYERFRIAQDGSMYANFAGTAISTELRSAYMCRAWVQFDGGTAGSTTIANQHLICIRYLGFWGSLLADDLTKQKIKDLELAKTGLVLTYPSNYTVGTEGRTNYTSPGDNIHYKWNGSAWVAVPASTGAWIGQITLTSTQPVTIKGSGNISSITRNSAGSYTINFVGAMPDTGYATLGTCDVATGVGPGIVRVQGIYSTTQVQIITTSSNTNAVFDPNYCSVAIFR